MNLKNFENHISPNIMQRGYDYYLEGHISKMSKHRDLNYEVLVEGSDIYNVKIVLDENLNILYSYCDCPYDMGPVCKHEVAAYYALAERFEDGELDQPATVRDELTVREVLNSVSKEELIRLIEDLTTRDYLLEKRIVTRFAKGGRDQVIDEVRELIQMITHKHLGSKGHIHYYHVSDFTGEFDELLEKAKVENDLILAVEITLMVFLEGIRAFQYADDSGGSVGVLVDESLETLEEIIYKSKAEPKELRSDIFAKISFALSDEDVEGWDDYREILLEILIEFSDDQHLKHQLQALILNMINAIGHSDHFSSEKEGLLNIYFLLIEKHGTREEVIDFIRKHADYTSFRTRLLDKSLDEKDYKTVLEIASEGEMQDQHLPGLVSKWKSYRYKVYEALGMQEEQEELAREFFIKGDYTYYQVLKDLHMDDFQNVYEQLKVLLQTQGHGISTNMYLKMIEEENDLEELQKVVKKRPVYIEEYADKLITHNKDLVLELYENLIMNKAEVASHRSMYSGVCELIRKFRKYAGEEEISRIINELQGSYYRKPAFMDELRKVKKIGY